MACHVEGKNWNNPPAPEDELTAPGLPPDSRIITQFRKLSPFVATCAGGLVVTGRGLAVVVGTGFGLTVVGGSVVVGASVVVVVGDSVVVVVGAAVVVTGTV